MKYTAKDSNFVTIYDCDEMAITTIARATGEMATIRVGDYAACGGKLTQEAFDSLLASDIEAGAA